VLAEERMMARRAKGLLRAFEANLQNLVAEVAEEGGDDAAFARHNLRRRPDGKYRGRAGEADLFEVDVYTRTNGRLDGEEPVGGAEDFGVHCIAVSAVQQQFHHSPLARFHKRG